MSPDPVTPEESRTASAWRRNAETYLTLIERGQNSVARTLLGCVLIVCAWFGLGIPLYFWLEQDAASGSLRSFIGANLGILVMLVGLALAVVKVQRRALLTLVTPGSRFDWYRAWQGFAVSMVLSALAFAVEWLLYPGRYSLNTDVWQLLWFVPVVLVLTPLQAATEELVFRGFLMQSLRTFMRSPWLIVAISSVLFVLPHLANPEAGHGAMIVAVYLIIAVLLALVTLRDGRLELAIGAHAATNIFIALVASYPESVLDTPALFMADVLDPVYTLASVIVCSVLFYAWFFWRRPA